MPDLIQVVGRDAGPDVAAHLFQRLGGEPAGHPHPRDRVGVLDVGLAERRLLLAHVLGADDVRGDLPGRGEPAGWSKVAMFWESNVL